jgi:hypothetical protein
MVGQTFLSALLWYSLYDFGGLAAVRHLREPARAGQSGYLFVFLKRECIPHAGGDECLFQFEPVFVRPDGSIDEEAVGPALSLEAIEDGTAETALPDSSTAFAAARQHFEQRAGIWEWADDVEFVGMSWVQFV